MSRDNRWLIGGMLFALAGLLMILSAELRTAQHLRDGWRPQVEATVYEYETLVVPRFAVTHRDTLDDGLVIRVVEDRVWREVVLYATWRDSTYLRVELRR